MASFGQCVSEVSAAGGISGEDAQGVLALVDSRAERIARERGLPMAEAHVAAARELAEEGAAAAAIERRNRMLNLRTRITRRDRILDRSEVLRGAFGDDGLALAVRNEIHALNTPTRGSRLSAEAEWRTRAVQYTGGMITELERAGLLPAVRRGTLEREWGRELYELSRHVAGEDANPGVTGSKEARQIAETISRYQSLAKQNLNRAGAWIGDYAGYISRQSHDPDTLRRVGFEAWRDAIMPGLDHDRTFEGVDDPQRFMRGVYNALITGVHLSDEGGLGFKDPAFIGPGNLAQRLSESRVLHFRDAESWLDYQHRFGTGTLIEQVMTSLERAARQEALMTRWGTNPRAEFEQDLRWLAERLRDVRPGEVDRLRQAEQDLMNRFGYLDGRANMPANRLGAKVGSAMRLWESEAKLGMVAFTHLSVGTTKAAELRYHGVGLFGGYSDFLQSILRGRGQGQTRELADLLLAGTEGMNRDIVSRFEPDDTVPGTLSKLANAFFKATGLTYLLNAQKAGAEFVLSRHLGRLVGREFSALPNEVRRTLSIYDISPAEWDTLRMAPGHKVIDGRTFLTPDAAHRALPQPDLAGADMLDAATRDRLALKLHAYFNDSAERSVITPGIAERALMLQGNRPGTLAGEALRFIAQFKTWPVAAIRQGLGRELYGGQGRAAAAAGVLHMALGSAISGYLVMTLKDLLKGQNPRRPDDPHTWAAAMMQGGGFGILGDYLFGEYNRFGQNAAESLLGPVLGQGLNSVLDLWDKAKEGRDLRPEALRVATDNLPFVNLFYTRLALNYLFLWQVQEALNPGFQRRYEQRLRQQTGQTFWLSPSATVAR